MLSKAQKTALRLVAGDGVDVAEAERYEHGFEAPTPTARPADRCEPWPIEHGPPLRALTAAAATNGVSLELAAVVVVERTLLASELSAYRRDELTERLEAEAAHARVTVELSPSLSAYLAALSGRETAASRPLPRSLALPMRLTERIVARQGRPQFDATLLASALAWERASVLEGRTMSEWAAVKALERSR